jgi:hypothetical protein
MQPVQLVLMVYMATNSRGWKSYPAVKHQVLCFIMSMANKVLSERHPLARTPACLMKDGATKTAMSSFCRLFLNAVDKFVDANERNLYYLHMDVADGFIMSGELETAQALCERTLISARSAYHQGDYIIRNTLRTLGRAFDLQDRDLDAEKVWLEVIHLTSEELGQPNADDVGINACRWLGALYEDQENRAESEYYYGRLAFAGALRKWGPNYPYTLRCLDDWESVLVKQGKVDEVAQLHIDYGYILEYWDNLEAPYASKM